MDADSLTLFEDSLRRYNSERHGHGSAPDGGDPTRGYSPARWSELQDLGWFELLRSDDQRLAIAPLADLLPLLMAAGEALWREPIFTVLAEPVAVVAAVEDRERGAELLEGLISGDCPLGYAHREPGDGWSNTVATSARKTASGHRLDGRKTMVVGVGACAAFLVSAIDPDTGMAGLFLVEADAPGLAVQRYRAIDDGVAADLSFTDTPAERLCAGDAVIRSANARGAILAAAESVGIMRGAIHDTTEYLRERKQFGQALLGFQALQHRLVEMLMRQHEADALLRATVEAYDQNRSTLPRQLLVLRVQLARALRHVTREAIQLHGGMGVTQELRVGRWYKRGLMLDSLHGTADWALDALSRFNND